MALIKGNVIVIGSNDESAPKKCEYCGKMEELRPYGINGANICFECGMKPENRATSNCWQYELQIEAHMEGAEMLFDMLRLPKEDEKTDCE